MDNTSIIYIAKLAFLQLKFVQSWLLLYTYSFDPKIISDLEVLLMRFDSMQGSVEDPRQAGYTYWTPTEAFTFVQRWLSPLLNLQFATAAGSIVSDEFSGAFPAMFFPVHSVLDNKHFCYITTVLIILYINAFKIILPLSVVCILGLRFNVSPYFLPRQDCTLKLEFKLIHIEVDMSLIKI